MYGFEICNGAWFKFKKKNAMNGYLPSAVGVIDQAFAPLPAQVSRVVLVNGELSKGVLIREPLFTVLSCGSACHCVSL